MDISKEYIKMCRKATEVQELWEPDQGDAYVIGGAMPGNKHFGLTYLGCCWEKCEGCRYEVNQLRDECVWLLRPDQLQDIISTIDYTLWHEYYKDDEDKKELWWGHDGFSQDKSRLLVCGESSEIILIQLVMHEKYGKKWSDGKWIE